MESWTKIVKFPLSKQMVRPFFDYDTGTEKITLLYDTGANIPVWCSGETLLKAAYPEAEETGMKTEVHGFGKQPESGSVFRIPEFELVAGKERYVLQNLYFLVIEKPSIGCDFLICPRMFEKSDCLITNREEKAISFLSDKERYVCTPIRNADGSFQKFVVWEQAG